MLIDVLVDFCDAKYTTYSNKCGSGNCNHPAGKCSGCCYKCLYQIHFPERFSGQEVKKLYDCPKMLYHYVCQYSYLYASELLYAFNAEEKYLISYPYFHIMSIGCGGCSDLMAFEAFYKERNLTQKISYIGIDINEYWKPIHNKIERYCDENNIMRRSIQADAFKFFSSYSIKDTNIIVISYLISYLYNSGQINTINSFITSLVKNIVLKKKKGEKLLIVVNDLNTYKRGRNYFSYFKRKIEKYNLSIVNWNYRYFDTGKLHDGQKIGTPYSSSKCLFSVPQSIAEKYHSRTEGQQTIQLLLEVIVDNKRKPANRYTNILLRVVF